MTACRTAEFTDLHNSPVHKSNMRSEKETPEAEGFGFICFDFFLFIYTLCACVGVCVDTVEEKMERFLTILTLK